MAGQKATPAKTKRPAMPLAFQPIQEPLRAEKAPTGSGWVHEIKFDGYRLQANVAAGRVTLFTRRGFDWTDRFPRLARELASLPDCILDGELCALGADGRPHFSQLVASIAGKETSELVLQVFDLLWLKREDMRPAGLMGRKEALQEVLGAIHLDLVREVEVFDAHGPTLFASACAMGLEGIVSKARDGPYKAGRGDSWRKIKCRPSRSVVIGGYIQEPMRPFGGLLLGVYDREGLSYAGSVQVSGGRDSQGLVKRLEALSTPACPFTSGKPPVSKSVHWVRPALVAEVEFAEWTASGKLRQPSFKGLRPDKKPDEVRRDRAAGDQLRGSLRD